MSREIYISSTPHETRLAIVEKDELTEIYYERENEYTLAGSIYNGRVTRVLPGMQSSFVDIGLERDAFLYITDFMEEQGDSADFESADRSARREHRPPAPRQEEGTESTESGDDAFVSNSGEGRRRRGERGRRGERPVRELTSSEEDNTALDTEADAAPTLSVAELPEEGSTEGSRRWRGRRGRRRGKTNGDESRTALSAGESNELNGSATDAEEALPAAERQQDRGGEDGREGRSRRQGRDRGREREPRYEAPREDEGLGLNASSEPLVLPGESLSKYRKGGDDAAGTGTFAGSRPQPTIAIARPSTEVVPIAGWDGGLTLPGETLSRHRGQAGASAPQADRSLQQINGNEGGRRRERDGIRGRRGATEQAEGMQPQTQSFSAPDLAAAVQPGVTSGHELEENILTLSDDAPAFDTERTEERLEIEAAALSEEVYEAQTDVAPPATETPFEVLEAVEEFHETVAEYEPSDDASASYRVDPVGPSEFRQSAPVLEEVPQAEEEATGTHEFTTLQPSGEMLSEAPNVPEAQVAPQDTEQPAAPIEHEAAVQSVHVEDAEVTPMPGTFAPGDGELEEELLDEDESDLPIIHADAFNDMEEETLEGAADLGSMIREMSIDEITRPMGDDHDDDDFEIDEEEMEKGEFAESDTEAEGLPGGEINDAEDEEFSEGDEFEETEPAATLAHADGVERQPRPDDKRKRQERGRGRDRGGRDRRGMSNSRSNGRPSRHSVQATDLPAISDLLKPGQEVLVQIAKEPIAKKGARITSHIALPGRFLVFMPTVNHVGVSRKIESDGERRRLKEILLSEKGEASGGFIVRTAAMGASEEELRNDLRFLLNLWADIKQRSEGSKSPALIYHDLNLVERILRDQVSEDFSAIWVDTETEFERVLRFLQRFQPSLIRRVKLYTKDTPLFEQFGITNEINKALRSKVWLKSGGSIVINQTEALVAIDINTGKYVGKTARLEDTIVKTNLDAIPEIVRQIRLRDLGGIIVIDFIDMDDRKNRHKVLAALEEELKKDRAPSKVLQFNDFGLVAITRKRVKQSLERTLSTTCGICAGTGMVKSPTTVCNEIYVELRKMHKVLDKGDVMLRVNPEVVKQLKLNNGKWLQEMEEISGKTILVKSDPGLHPEQFDIH